MSDSRSQSLSSELIGGGWSRRFQELVVMGAPGSYYWTGTIKVYNLTSDTFYSPNKEEVDSHRYSYLGERRLLRMLLLLKNFKHSRQL